VDNISQETDTKEVGEIVIIVSFLFIFGAAA
jgi:hypothetical protein